MARSFDLVLSETLKPGDVAEALAALIPAGLKIDVGLDIANVPDEPGAIWALVTATDDVAWPC